MFSFSARWENGKVDEVRNVVGNLGLLGQAFERGASGLISPVFSIGLVGGLLQPIYIGHRAFQYLYSGPCNKLYYLA